MMVSFILTCNPKAISTCIQKRKCSICEKPCAKCSKKNIEKNAYICEKYSSKLSAATLVQSKL